MQIAWDELNCDLADRETSCVDGRTWLPIITARTILPVEQCRFRVSQAQACAAVHFSREFDLPLIATCAVPSDAAIGTTLRIEKCRRTGQGDELEIDVVGLRPVRILARST